MKLEELLKHVLWGRLLVVGEYRGSKAEKKALVDKHNTGEAISYVRAIHLLECRCRGNLDRATVYERLPDVIEEPDEAIFCYERGRM